MSTTGPDRDTESEEETSEETSEETLDSPTPKAPTAPTADPDKKTWQ
jgi:hypothetical protein